MTTLSLATAVAPRTGQINKNCPVFFKEEKKILQKWYYMVFTLS